MEQLKKAFHAALGSGDLAVEKSKELAGTARRSSGRVYRDLTTRGEKVVTRARRIKPAKRAAEGTKQATRQIKGAYTSIRKALGAEPAKPSRPARPSTTRRKAS